MSSYATKKTHRFNVVIPRNGQFEVWDSHDEEGRLFRIAVCPNEKSANLVAHALNVLDHMSQVFREDEG